MPTPNRPDTAGCSGCLRAIRQHGDRDAGGQRGDDRGAQLEQQVGHDEHDHRDRRGDDAGHAAHLLQQRGGIASGRQCRVDDRQRRGVIVAQPRGVTVAQPARCHRRAAARCHRRAARPRGLPGRRSLSLADLVVRVVEHLPPLPQRDPAAHPHGPARLDARDPAASQPDQRHSLGAVVQLGLQ